MNFANSAHEWDLVEKLLIPLLPKTAKVENDETTAIEGEEREQHGLEALRSFARLLSRLGEMHGSTIIDQNGSFTCLVENRPRQ